MPRDTFILEQDIAERQLNDVHPKTGTRLQKLVDKKVIDSIYFEDVAITPGATSVRIDMLLLDQPQGTGPTAFGVLTDKRHEVFRTIQDEAYIDINGQKVTVELSFAASLSFLCAMVTGNASGITVGNPGDVQIGDWVRIQGQGLVSPFSAQVMNKVPSGPNFILTFSNVFLQGVSQNYTVERISRWEAIFRDSANALFQIPDAALDLGIFKRVYLADVAETYGNQPLGDRGEFGPDGGVVVGPPGAPFSSSVLELLIDPGDTFLWFHGLITDIPILTWWVEWPGYPTVRYFYGMQASPSGPFESHVGLGIPTLEGTFPVDFQHIDQDSILITNRNSVQHRVKAIVFKAM